MGQRKSSGLYNERFWIPIHPGGCPTLGEARVGGKDLCRAATTQGGIPSLREVFPQAMAHRNLPSSPSVSYTLSNTRVNRCLYAPDPSTLPAVGVGLRQA